jgi:tricorn protease
VDEGRYRITRVYRSAHFNAGNPLMQAPLDQPGVAVNEGDYLLEVDGQAVSGGVNLYSYFTGKALKPTRITVSANPTGESPRTYTVVPLPGENTLRRINWAERNRRTVEEESRGILGYIYIPSFSTNSLEMVFRQLLESGDRRGLIIDERFNSGGITADYLIEWLRRRPLYYYAFRQGSNLAIPTNPPPAAQVLLINEFNASAAETFAFMFTRGAGIGGFGFVPPLIDGGRITIPNRAAFDPAGDWGIENQGVEPDNAVHIMPVDWRQGRDPQLAAAINTVLQMIVDNPPPEVKRPEYPEHE